MSNLKQVLTDIQNEKNTKLIPNNIKAGVTIMNVTGTYDGGGGGEETPAFIEFEGENYIVKVCNYNGWSSEHIHAILDDYVTTDVISAIESLYDADPSDIKNVIENNWDPEVLPNIIHAMNIDLDTGEPLEEPWQQYFRQWFITNIIPNEGEAPYIDHINIEMTSETSVDVLVPGICWLTISYEVDSETGDAILTVGEVQNISVDTYEANAVESDVAVGKSFVARGELLEGTATSMPSASIVLHSENGIIYCDDEAAVNALYDIKNNHFAESFTLAIGMNSIKYTYVATFANHYDVSTGDDIPLLITFNADLENKTARYSFQEDKPGQTHKLELTNIEFNIDIYQ